MSKQVSEAIKAKRKQHRQDHFTDADRQLFKSNKGNQKARVAARRENFAAQGNKSAADFNFDQHGKGHIGQQEIKHLRNQGHSRKDIMAAAKANGGELSERTQNRFARWGAAKEKAKAAANNPTPTPTGGTGNSGDNTAIGTGNQAGNNNEMNNSNNGSNNDVSGDGSAVGNNNTAAGNNNDIKGDGNAVGAENLVNNQDVNAGNTDFKQSQDNDQEIVNNGDNNYNYQRQDNSNRIYGGDTRVFNYQNSSNEGGGSPVSAATMGGFYEVNDSHAANAARLDRQVTMANDFAKDNMDTDWIAQGAIHKARNNTTVNPNQLDERIAAREANDFAQAKIDEVKMFGDLDGQSMDWTQPDPAKPVEKPDFEKMYNTYTDY